MSYKYLDVRFVTLQVLPKIPADLTLPFFASSIFYVSYHKSDIYSYGGGTHPWNKSGGAFEPSTEDGLIEVVGLTTYQLVIQHIFDLFFNNN